MINRKGLTNINNDQLPCTNKKIQTACSTSLRFVGEMCQSCKQLVVGSTVVNSTQLSILAEPYTQNQKGAVRSRVCFGCSGIPRAHQAGAGAAAVGRGVEGGAALVHLSLVLTPPRAHGAALSRRGDGVTAGGRATGHRDTGDPPVLRTRRAIIIDI